MPNPEQPVLNLDRHTFYMTWGMDGNPPLLEAEGRVFYVDEFGCKIMLKMYFASCIETGLPLGVSDL